MHDSHSAEKRMEIRSKLWIEVGGKPVFGRGRMMLLRAVEKHGSINSAAREIDISYRKAWGYIDAMEKRLGIPLVNRHTGGRHGGGTTLTREAADFLEKYGRLEEDIQKKTDESFHEIFSQ